MFRVYRVSLTINEIHFSEVWIDPHYELKHRASINDDLILLLLRQIDLHYFEAAAQSYGFSYYEVDIEHRTKPYRLILVIPDDGTYLGIRNAYRRSK